MYKFVKLYFAEQEKKWVITLNKLKDKIKVYKEICESFVKQNDVLVEKIELVNDILFSQRLTPGKILFITSHYLRKPQTS